MTAAKRDFLSLADYTAEELLSLVERSKELKRGVPDRDHYRPLHGRYVGLVFEKASTRTRVSFEVGIRQLGGEAIFLSGADLQLSRGEPVRDTARVLSKYLDALIVRTFGHDELEEFARWSSIPVVNGLSDHLHPCQILADLLTAYESGLDITTMKTAWIGDGNNMANSWIHAAKILGFSLVLACPEGFDPTVELDSANVVVVRNPVDAARDADVISTDVWASMGREKEAKARKKAFKGFQVNAKLLKAAKSTVRVLHCLPAHRGEEISDEVLESSRSLVWDQAENRLHAQKAVLEMVLR